MSVIIPRNTTIPARKTSNYVTIVDYQTGISIPVYEGERTLIVDNNLLGSFELIGITPGLRGVTKADVTIEVDADGILHVTAKEVGTNVQNQITIVNEKGRLSKGDIERLIKDAKKFRCDDEKKKLAIAAKNALEEFCLDMQSKIKAKEEISDDDRKNVLEKCNDAIEWLKAEKSHDKEQCEGRQKELQCLCNLILLKVK